MSSATTYLNSELSRRAHHDCLNLALTQVAILTEILGRWQAEGKCFAATGQVARNHVLPIVDRVETVLLDREKRFDTPRYHLLG